MILALLISCAPLAAAVLALCFLAGKPRPHARLTHLNPKLLK